MSAPSSPAARERLGWYARRLRAMSPAEVGWRAGDRVRQEVWARRGFGPPPGGVVGHGGDPVPPPTVGGVDLAAVPRSARDRVLAAAERVLGGDAWLLGSLRRDMADPTWALDPVSGRRFPVDRCAFRIDYRSPADPRDVKAVWELSRHHHLTLLAAAWRLSGDDRHAATVAHHLTSWWEKNPVLSGVNWASGIELGIRLIAWTWVRRLLDGWPGAAALFERNPLAARQLYWHQRYLATFRSRGSSANNHVIAEAAGLLSASCAFPWFPESIRWQREAADLLETELERNTFPSGIDREQAFEYHGLVAELGLVAVAEAAAAGAPPSAGTWSLLCRMVDAVAAVVDRNGRPPRHGDGDDGRALVVDDPGADRWQSLLAVGAAVFGPLPWWPQTTPDVLSSLLGGLVGRTVRVDDRPEGRPSHFADAGITILRSPPAAAEEIWCRCDGGPHGFLSIGAHAHADALSIELRLDGVELLVDPGTYCYHAEPAWRRYFRSSIAHNTLEVDGQDQSVAGGPFLWLRGARTNLLEFDVATSGRQLWSAEHDGYRRLPAPAVHRRTVLLDVAARQLRIDDLVSSDGRHDVRLAFHLGPSVDASLDGTTATLGWPRPGRGRGAATLSLPTQLCWRAYRGSTDPMLGWYSSGFGRKEATTSLVGHGRLASGLLATEVRLTGPVPASGAHLVRDRPSGSPLGRVSRKPPGRAPAR